MDVSESLERALGGAGIGPGEACAVAVSGGSDSTALMHLMSDGRLGLRLHVLHVDHGLRESSVADSSAVASAATDLGLPWSILRVRVPGDRRSPEEAARDVRNHALERAAHALGLRWVVTGHTRDDQAETVLLRLLRGAGTRGVAGIPSVREPFVRPLLDTTRDQIRVWLTQRGIAWREDPTNADVVHDRNWVRSEVMPLLAGRYPGVRESLARHAAHARADEEALDALAAAVCARARSGGVATEIGWDDMDVDHAVAVRVVRRLLESHGGRADSATIGRVLGLRGHPPGSAITTGPGCDVRRTADGLAFVDTGAEPPAALDLPQEGVVEDASWGLRLRVGSGGEPWTWRCRLDAVRSGLTIRGRRDGDRVRTAGGTKKVQDVLVDAKVPRFVRDRVAILADGEEAVAVVGLTVPPSSSPVVVVDAQPIEGAGWWSPDLQGSS